MSFNRLIYDPCAYNKKLDGSSSILTYTLDPNKHYNCTPCRIGFGLVGGNNVSLNSCNLVQLESDLRGQTRVASKCDERKYLPHCQPSPFSTDGLPCPSQECNKIDLPTCEMIHYKPKISNIGYQLDYPSCPRKVNCNLKQGTRMRPACQSPVTWNDGPLPMTYPGVYRF